jgi:hypothetical protein
MIISFILYKALKMKEYKGFIYRYDKNKNLIISRNPVDCALSIGSPSGVIFYEEIERLNNAN